MIGFKALIFLFSITLLACTSSTQTKTKVENQKIILNTIKQDLPLTSPPLYPKEISARSPKKTEPLKAFKFRTPDLLHKLPTKKELNRSSFSQRTTLHGATTSP